MLPSSLLCRLTTAVAQSRSVPTRLLPVPALTPSCVRALIYRPVHPPLPPFNRPLYRAYRSWHSTSWLLTFLRTTMERTFTPCTLSERQRRERGGGGADAYMSSGPHTVSSDVVESIGLCEGCMLKMRVVVVGCERNVVRSAVLINSLGS